MHQEEIKDGNLLIAKIIRSSVWPEGLMFYSQPDDFLQFSTWNYTAGKHLKAHGHKICRRVSNRTNEFIFIKSGRIKAYFYNATDQIISEV